MAHIIRKFKATAKDQIIKKNSVPKHVKSYRRSRHDFKIGGLCYRNTAYVKVNVKFSRYRPGVAQRVGRGVALFFHDRCTRRG